MGPSRITMRVLATLTLWAGFGLTAHAQLPTLTVDKALEAKPRQPGVAVTPPTPADAARFRVDPIPNPKQPGSNIGYVVRDAQGKPVRQFVSYDGKGFNIVAFYVDGQEAYREVFPPSPSEPHQFRWLGPNGGKWGLDKDRDGKIDEWVVMSPEEASQELFQAVQTGDGHRLNALLPTKENLDSLGLPADRSGPILDRAKGAAKRLAEAAAALKLSPNAKWVHLELGVPHTTPADAFGGRDDLVAHKNATILIQDGDKTHFLQTGEMIAVGRAWKLIEGPSAGLGGVPTADAGSTPVIDGPIKGDVEELDKLDNSEGKNATTPERIAAYYAKRSDILERIVQKLPPEKQELWVRLLIDSLAAAADGGKPDSKPHARLKQLTDALTKGGPQNPLAPYAAFRLIAAENGIALAGKTGKELEAAMEMHRKNLEGFIKAYPTAEDTPEAVLRLALAFEALGKDGDAKAKEWYGYLAKTYAQHPHAAKATGAVKRLESEGKPLELQGPNIANGQSYSAAQATGKVLVVYYWASWSSGLGEDAKKLKELVAAYGGKGLEVVTVCLDDDAKAAQQTAAGLQLPGTHLHQPGGVDRSPLAVGYGIPAPPHVFLVGKDGKVINRSAQIPTLEDDLKKMMP